MATSKKAVVDKIKALLEQKVLNSHVDVDLTPSGSVFGTVTAPVFEGKPDRTRQELVWQYLRADLKATELSKIAAILALTPAEEKRLTGE